ncbi:hypothetical protein UB44_21770 [Burkholderiaceae bacterium 26]|nr:hypothetical protein UB44_21770 [Burkholderiaceae bacterium 26]
MLHLFVNVVCMLARLVLAVPQGFAVTFDIAMLGAEFTVLLVALRVPLMLYALGTFMVRVFRTWRGHGLRQGSSTGNGQHRGKQGVFGFHGVAPLELS